MTLKDPVTAHSFLYSFLGNLLKFQQAFPEGYRFCDPDIRMMNRISPPSTPQAWVFAWYDSGDLLYLFFAAVYAAPYAR